MFGIHDLSLFILSGLLLGIIFIFNSLFITVGISVLVAQLQKQARGIFSSASRVALWHNRSCGALFIAIGVKLALTEESSI